MLDVDRKGELLAGSFTSTDGAFELMCFHRSRPANSAATALKEFARAVIAEHPTGQVSQWQLGKAPAAVVGFSPDGEKLRVGYRISFVSGGRQYFVHALAPPLSSLDRLPNALADVLGRIEFLQSKPNDGGPTVSDSPSPDPAASTPPVVSQVVTPSPAAPPPTSSTNSPLTPDCVPEAQATQPPPNSVDASVTLSPLTSSHEPRAGGFVMSTLPAVLDQATTTVHATSVSRVALSNGVTLLLPPGSLPNAASVTLRHLRSDVPDAFLYHIEAEPSDLLRPAEFLIPVGGSPDAPIRLVQVMHFHNQDDPGRVLPVQWNPGEPTAKVELDRFSLVIPFLIGSTALAYATECVVESVNSDEELQKALASALAKHPQSAELKTPCYRQNDTAWCWAATIAMQAGGNRTLTENLDAPFKPQTMAARVGANPADTYAVWRLVGGNYSEPFKSLGTDVEIKRWFSYGNLAQYLIENLSMDRTIAIFTQSEQHFRLAVGYTDSSLIVNDPDSDHSPLWIPWPMFFSLMKGSDSQTGNGVWTVVQKRKVTATPTEPASKPR